MDVEIVIDQLVQLGLNGDRQKTLDEMKTSLKQLASIPSDFNWILYSTLPLLQIILAEHEQVQQLKQKVDQLEERLLLEISNAPPKFIPP